MAARKVVFSHKANRRLAELYDYIADNGAPLTAIDYVRRIRQVCLSLSEFPERGVSRSHIETDLRTITMERRVTIVYRVLKSRIVIVTVAYAGLDFERELKLGK